MGKDEEFHDWLIGANDEKSHEHVRDAEGSAEQMSNCCSAKVYLLGDNAICGDCKEYCDVVTAE